MSSQLSEEEKLPPWFTDGSVCVQVPSECGEVATALPGTALWDSGEGISRRPAGFGLFV